MNEPAGIEQNANLDLLREAAQKDAPRPFAFVEEYRGREEVRVAGYGLAL